MLTGTSARQGTDQVSGPARTGGGRSWHLSLNRPLSCFTGSRNWSPTIPAPGPVYSGSFPRGGDHPRWSPGLGCPAGSAPAADTSVDLNGRAVLPGWVDSHTQMIFTPDRVENLTARLSSERSTVEVQTTVDATRAAGDPELLAVAGRHRREMLNGGTTCANTMTGYGPTVPDQARAAATAQAAGFDDITFLAAHTGARPTR